MPTPSDTLHFHLLIDPRRMPQTYQAIAHYYTPTGRLKRRFYGELHEQLRQRLEMKFSVDACLHALQDRLAQLDRIETKITAILDAGSIISSPDS